MRLPIDDCLEDLISALRARGRAVLQAPPGAGKTTRVPLALLQAGLTEGLILILEPRRLAARAAAERMAQTLGEDVGQTVGYRMRGEAKVSSATRIEVVTEGILTRRLQSDPELAGVGIVIFDEFHERSLNADLGLALCLEVADVLRDDLQLLVMSATLEAAPVAALMGDVPVVTSQGRSYPVERVWLPRPMDASLRFEAAAAQLIAQAVEENEGSVLAFLPGEGEIRRVMAALDRRGVRISVRPLFGAMPLKDQRAAIAADGGRKLVLATAIAETSLTIEGITVVVDCGQARRARFDPASGMARLVTERVTKAEATQRAGRAGRMAPGRAYAMWTKGEEGGMAAFAPPEIAIADLSGLALDLALWGTSPEDLAFLTAPPEGPLLRARALLQRLGALDEAGKITAQGRRMAALPLHPRLARMVLLAGKSAAPLAALLSDRDPLRNAGADLGLRLKALRAPGHAPPPARGALERIKQEARRLERLAPDRPTLPPAQQAALAYPDRIAALRKAGGGRYLMAMGKEAEFPAMASDPLKGHPFLVITDLDGDRRSARIRQALPISEADLRAVASDQIRWQQRCTWSDRRNEVEAWEEEVLGAIALQRRPWTDVAADVWTAAVVAGFQTIGLPLTPAARRFRARVDMLRQGDPDFPDLSDEALLARADEWLAPVAHTLRTKADLQGFDMTPAFEMMLSWDDRKRLDTLAPPAFVTPLGRKVPIDYALAVPEVAVKLQEMFGLIRHPTVGAHKAPLRLTLLSPAGRPLQVTQDLPGFWASSYQDVRKDMRGRYPRHPWPEDPTQAAPTTRVKPRGT